MKLTEAIKALEKIQEKHGDINMANLDGFAVVPIVTGNNEPIRTDVYVVTKNDEE